MAGGPVSSEIPIQGQILEVKCFPLQVAHAYAAHADESFLRRRVWLHQVGTVKGRHQIQSLRLENETLCPRESERL